uniref:Cullin N-terminal domain-containing protein n=1 Tax=Ditylenchus dipsaci TaxID=166011 RepID=A0A915DZP9_9BILA
MQRHQQSLSTINNEKHAEMFEKIKQAIVAIQSKQHSSLSFEVLYRSSYTLVCEKHGDLLLDAYQKLTKQHLTETVVPELLRCVDASGNFLEILCRFWNEYSTMLGMIRDILMYLDRVYIQPGMLSVYQSALSMFRTEVSCVHVVNEQIQLTLLSMISSERHGQSIQWGIIKSIVKMLMALGIESRAYYEDNFERFFLKETEDHYRLAAERFIAEKSSIEYVEKVHKCIAYEFDRCQRYLDSSTEAKVNSLLIIILASESKVTAVLEKKDSGFEFMLNNNRINDLVSLFEFVKHSKRGPQKLVDILGNHVCTKGKQIMSAIESKVSNPVDSIEEIANLHEQFDEYLVNAFKNDQACRKAIQSAIEEFFNLSSRSPEYLSLYIDDKLKKGPKKQMI